MDELEWTVEPICPLCGNKAIYHLPVQLRPTVLLCEPEDGGCDNYFAVRVMLKPVISYYSVKEVPEWTPDEWSQQDEDNQTLNRIIADGLHGRGD
jgi:hypothetical protein